MGLVLWSCAEKNKPLEKYGPVRMITLTSASGHVLPSDYFSSDITVVEFIFLSCTGACPIMNTQLKAVYQQLDPSLPVRFLSVSVDPDRDTGKKLAEFQSTMGVDSSRWIFARGNQAAIHQWIEKQFHLGVGALPAEHPTRLVLIDRNQEIRGYFDGLSKSSVAPLVDAIHQLLAEDISGPP